MSDSDPPPPPYSGDNAGRFWPQVPMNGDHLDSYSKFEQPPPFKNHIYSENNPMNPFVSPQISDGNAGGFWPQVSKKRDYLDSYSQFEQPPPFKRPRNTENKPTNFVPSATSNPRMNPPIPPMNRGGTNNIFYKTHLCIKFLEGNCKNGDNCTFAHGPEDKREPPPNWKELVKDRGAGNWNDDEKIIHKMKICKKFYNGEVCPYGEKCNFLHESPAKFKSDMAVDMATAMAKTRQSYGNDFNKHLYSNSDAIQVNVNANSDALRVNENANSDAFKATMKPANWKTRICVRWEVGMCTYAERCRFAHGQSELQLILNGCADQHREVMMNAAGGSIAAYPSAVVTISDVPPTISAVPAPIKEGGEVKKGFATWGPNKKINHIYGDWIDDLSPP